MRDGGGHGRFTRIMCSAVLSFEAVMMLLSILLLNGFSDLSRAAAAWTGGGLAVLCVVAAGGLGRSWGYALGHLLQVAMCALGLFVPAIVLVGLMSATLWVAAYVVGMKIDRDRADRERAVA